MTDVSAMAAAIEYLEMRLKQPADKGGWRNERHRKQWAITMQHQLQTTAQPLQHVHRCNGHNG